MKPDNRPFLSDFLSCFPPWLGQVEANLVAQLSSVILPYMALPRQTRLDAVPQSARSFLVAKRGFRSSNFDDCHPLPNLLSPGQPRVVIKNEDDGKEALSGSHICSHLVEQGWKAFLPTPTRLLTYSTSDPRGRSLVRGQETCPQQSPSDVRGNFDLAAIERFHDQDSFIAL